MPVDIFTAGKCARFEALVQGFLVYGAVFVHGVKITFFFLWKRNETGDDFVGCDVGSWIADGVDKADRGERNGQEFFFAALRRVDFGLYIKPLDLNPHRV